MPAVNERISEYILDQRIGGGTFGEVWRAHHHVWTDQRVAIKIPTDPQYVRNLQREGQAIHGLVHPNIARAIGFDPYAQVPYLTMEYVPGSSLRPLIAGRAMSAADAVSVMRQVLAGLGYAHGQGVVHRDVKPENILIHERALIQGYHVQGAVKVTDFGLGQAASQTAAQSIAYSASLNSPAGRDIAGTLDYMAPEQRSGETVDGRADLYACGVILYEMLTGERPAGTEVPSDLVPSVPAHLDMVFRRSYSRLENRFGSAAEFIKALDPVMPPPLPQRGGGQLVAPPIAPRATPKRKPSDADAPSHPCPQCHGHVSAGDQFCMHCGVQLVARVRRCPRCGGYPRPGDSHCNFCGERLTQGTSVA